MVFSTALYCSVLTCTLVGLWVGQGAGGAPSVQAGAAGLQGQHRLLRPPLGTVGACSAGI